MRRALDEYHVGGIETNLPFHRQVMRHPAFIAGEYDTGFIERHKAELQPAAPDEETATLAAVVAAAEAQARGPRARPVRSSIYRRRRSRHGGETRRERCSVARPRARRGRLRDGRRVVERGLLADDVRVEGELSARGELAPRGRLAARQLGAATLDDAR